MKIEFGTEWVGFIGKKLTSIKVVKVLDGEVGFIKDDDGYDIYYISVRSFMNNFTPNRPAPPKPLYNPCK